MKTVKKIIYPICLVLLLVAAVHLWKIDSSTRHTRQLYASLAREADMNISVSNDPASENTDEAPVNAWLLNLKKQNSDLVGWIRIPGTVIDYPVMQNGSDDEYYLTHDFEKKENVHGVPFLDAACIPGKSDNLILYGHHMKDGTMFQNLMLYQDPAFCETNGTICLDILSESATYQVIFVLLITEEETRQFPYYQCTDLSDGEIYQGFLRQCSRYAIWQSKDLPSAGTKLLTLSTCEYTRKNGRLVVVAKQVPE